MQYIKQTMPVIVLLLNKYIIVSEYSSMSVNCKYDHIAKPRRRMRHTWYVAARFQF